MVGYKYSRVFLKSSHMIREASELKNSKFVVWPPLPDFIFSLNILLIFSKFYNFMPWNLCERILNIESYLDFIFN